MAKVLLVDDTLFFRKMYCDILHNAGYDVIEASDGLEGIKKAQEEQPDLILLDIAMPRLDGLCALEQLKGDSRTSNIKVIVLSSKDAVEGIKEALRQGAVDYLIKTGNKPLEVVEKIKNTLASAEAEAAVSKPQQVAEGDASPGFYGSPPTAAQPQFSRHKQYRIFLRDREEDADSLVDDCRLPQRFWCPKCQEELILELTPDTGLGIDTSKHRFKARLVCSRCSAEF